MAKAIDYLSSFLKVERATQNLKLQRWVSATPETISPNASCAWLWFTRCCTWVSHKIAYIILP